MKHPNNHIEVLLSALANQKLPTIDLSLDRISNLLNVLGNPQDRLPTVIHIAGTNGKGSLVAYLTAIFEAAGYKVNRLTSPYLVKFNEQMYLSGKDIDDAQLLSLLQKTITYVDKYPVTFFEASTALAYLAFAENEADITLLETGLGGRLDATNMVKSPALTAITPISIDHKEFLGETISKIAGEKAGILKRNVPCVVGKQEAEAAKVIEQTAKKINSPLYRIGAEWSIEEEKNGFRYASGKRKVNMPLPNLTGHHQIFNAATAIACIDLIRGFKITDEHIAKGITHAMWPARLQHITKGTLANLIPKESELWLDGAHNPGAGQALAEWLKVQKKPVHMICGMLQDKDAEHFISPLTPYIKSLTAISIEGKKQSYNPDQLSGIARKLGVESHTYAGNKIEEAISGILKKEDAISSGVIILICGSLYLAGNILHQNGELS